MEESGPQIQTGHESVSGLVSQYIILRSRFSLVAIFPPFGGRVNEHSEEQSEDRHSEYSTLWRDKSTLNQPDPAHWRARFQEWVTTRNSLLRATATAIAEAHFLAMDREIAFLRLGCRSMRFLKSQIIVCLTNRQPRPEAVVLSKAVLTIVAYTNTPPLQRSPLSSAASPSFRYHAEVLIYDF
jgi:hypothetical protein